MFDDQLITDTSGIEKYEYVTLPEHQFDTMAMQLEAAQSALSKLARDDQGWMNLTGGTINQISHPELISNANQVRAFSQMNPLMKRAKILRSGYIFGDGVTFTPRSDGKLAGTQDVATVIHNFLEDNRNLAAAFSTNAQHTLEHDLFDDGNAFLGHWVNPMTGDVQVRQISFEEITQIRTRPGDPLVPQYYLREWTVPGRNGQEEARKAWYPDLRHHPSSKEKMLDQIPVMWPGKSYPGFGTGAAIYHLKVNAVGRDRIWGVGDGYAAMPWAKAYTGFMTDWAGLMNTLSNVGYHLKGQGGRDQLARAAANMQGGGAGGVSYGSFELEAPNIRGASFDADSGRPLAALVGAALGLPVTILTADPGSTGARAVAETLEAPQKNEMKARQRVHVSYYRAVCDFVIQQAVLAPRGPLNATVLYRDDQRIIEFRDKTDPVVDVDMPDLENPDLTVMVDAIAKADATGKLPPVESLKLFLTAFGFDDIANIVDEQTDDDGQWIDPYQTLRMNAGQAAADAHRRGENPADYL